jgi:RNA polymerase sigma-70 factor, ECF subfamily
VDDFVMGSPPERQRPAVVASTEAVRTKLDFRTIFQLELAYVMSSLRSLSVPPKDLEDMAHEVFLAVHAQLDAYDPSRPLRPWLFGFAFRVAAAYRRKARRETELVDQDDVLDGGDAPDAELERNRKRRLVLAALDQLDLDRRAVFILHEIDGLTCEQVARTLEIPVGTVYSRLRLARDDFSAAVRRLKARGTLA